MLSFFDLHCDTLSRAYTGGYSILSSPLHISLDKSSIFRSYGQLMAVWTDDTLNNEAGFERYKKIISYAKNQGITFSKSSSNLQNISLFLSIEDLRIIGTDMQKLDELYNDGVRFVIPFWSKENQFGGAWNTQMGLSELGKLAVHKMLDLNIVLDVSHSSILSIDEILNICSKRKKAPIASHSNAFSVCNHKRNLTKQHFWEIMRLGGVVGISLCPEHLSSSGFATIDDVARHIDYYLSLGGEDHICFGCDFDGVSSLPLKIHGLSDIPKIYLKIVKLYGESVANKIFYDNARTFINKTLS